MKKKIVILGSTGSIGEETLKIIKKQKKKFNVVLLSSNNSASKLLKQAQELFAPDCTMQKESYRLT